MILNGKCKEDFFKWNDEKAHVSEYALRNCLISPTLINALIIDFFDSVDIYVNVLRYGSSKPNQWIVIKSLCENNLDFIYSSRKEATDQAIIKANNIYNGK